MSWADLLKELSTLSPEQLNTDVTVFIPGLDEFYATKSRIFFASEANNDVLDDNHPYLSL